MTAKPLKRKPQQGRSLVTYNIIIESAAQVLLHRDYISTTTNRIAERAGVSVGSIYQYFRNKNEIYDAALDYYLSKIVESVLKIDMKDDVSLGTIIETTVFEIYDCWPQLPELLRKLGQAPDAHFDEKMKNLRAQIVSYFKAIIVNNRKMVNVDDLDIALEITMNAIEGIFLNADSAVPPAQLAREMALLCSRYLQSN